MSAGQVFVCEYQHGFPRPETKSLCGVYAILQFNPTLAIVADSRGDLGDDEP
jgi:hypothetical protein